MFGRNIRGALFGTVQVGLLYFLFGGVGFKSYWSLVFILICLSIENVCLLLDRFGRGVYDDVTLHYLAWAGKLLCISTKSHLIVNFHYRHVYCGGHLCITSKTNPVFLRHVVRFLSPHGGIGYAWINLSTAEALYSQYALYTPLCAVSV